MSPAKQELDQALAAARDHVLRAIEAACDLPSTSGRLGPQETAYRLERQRIARDLSFPAGLFGDPGWNVLVAVYLAQAENQAHGQSAVIARAGVKQTTGLRWLYELESAGLLQFRPSATSRRVKLVELTRKGRSMIERALGAMS